jgi:hypothetical protein
MMGFPSIIDNSIYNSILLDITCKYIKNVCMDVLRAKENLIYGIDVISSINYCGTTVQINLNVSNENAKKKTYIKKILPILFNFDKMVLVYTSQKSMA